MLALYIDFVLCEDLKNRILTSMCMGGRVCMGLYGTECFSFGPLVFVNHLVLVYDMIFFKGRMRLLFLMLTAGRHQQGAPKCWEFPARYHQSTPSPSSIKEYEWEFTVNERTCTKGNQVQMKVRWLLSKSYGHKSNNRNQWDDYPTRSSLSP